jgi:hypothetical protein
MITDLLIVLGVIVFFLLAIAWYLIGRAICLLILNEFMWKYFIEDWNDFEGETPIETIMFLFFPFTILFIGLSRIKF